MSEATLLRPVLQALALRGFFAWRNNSGLTLLGAGKSRRVIRGAPAGSPDIFLVIRGHLFGIEIKSKKGKLRATQVRWAERAAKHGVHYGVARSVGEAMALVDGWMRARGWERVVA